MMMLGAEAVFVGSGIFKSAEPAVRARAIVGAVQHWEDPVKVLAFSRGLGEPMPGLDIHLLSDDERLQLRSN